MKLSARDIESFVKKPPTCLGALVYGPDTGLVYARAETLAKFVVEDLADPFRVVSLEAETLKEDPARLADELTAMSFGGGKRLVRLRADTAAGLSTIVQKALAVIPPDIAQHAFLLVTADDLPASSGLRKLFEAESQLVALPCYIEDARGLKPVAQAELKARGIQFSSEVVDYICEHCQGDRLVIVSEIAKLDLYLGADRRATLDIAEACIGSTTESTLDSICASAAGGNQAEVERHLRRALGQGVVPVVVLRSMQNQMARLARVTAMTGQGMGQEEAIGSLRPPVFWKQKPAFMRLAARWGAPSRRNKIPAALHILYEAELACKTTGADPELMCSRALTQLAAM